MSSSKFGTIVRSLATLVLALIASTSALGYEQIVYYHNDLAGSPIGATDQSGNVVWKESYAPYGQRLRNQDNTNKVWFHGKPADIETGLSYFGARYYDPVIGRFMGPDPARYDEKNIHSVNRYAYGSNNPYAFRDADGQVVETIIDVVSLGLSIAAFKEDPTIVNGLGLAYDAIATATPFLPAGFGILKNAGRAADALGDAARVTEETVTVQRWMSKAELKATRDTGLLRGGREGTHHVTDAANADPLRARQRLALDRTPEVKATLEVPANALSAPSRVNPKFNMPGGGMERTATGNVPARVVGVD